MKISDEAVGATETPMSDHVARFWQLLKTEHVRILINMRREIGIDAPDGPIEYWDGASFSDEVAKALIADHAASTNALEQIALLDEADGHELTKDHAFRAVAIATRTLGKHPSEIAALTAALPHLQAQTLPLVHCARAQGTTFEEMRKNLPHELYMRGDTILAWVNEGEIIMHEMALVAERREVKP